MMDNLANALLITALGMGLVFAAILLLWLLMAVLVRLTGERALPPRAAAAMEALEDEAVRDRKQRAAIAAVAVALAREALGPQPFSAPRAAVPSAWQAVTRSRQLKQRGPLR